ncbi:MAG: hypothetical protein ACRCYR_11855 [Phycicoccus sp.]
MPPARDPVGDVHVVSRRVSTPARAGLSAPDAIVSTPAADNPATRLDAAAEVERAAEKELVVITEHDRPSYVLMTYAEFQRLHRAPADLAAWLEMSSDAEADIDVRVEPIGQWIEPARW